MIIGKSQKEIEKMRASGQLVGHVLRELSAMVEPGLTTIEVDATAEKMVQEIVAGAYELLKKTPLEMPVRGREVIGYGGR